MVTRRVVTAGLLAAGLGPVLPAKAKPLLSMRGFALADWISDQPRAPGEQTLATMRQLGFDTVRLPIDFRKSPNGDPLAQIAQAIRLLEKHGFATVLDLHMGDMPQASIETGWRLLAPLAGHTNPDTVLIEILNEPDFETGEWLSLRDRLAGQIRKHAPDHTLIWGPARYQGIWELENEPPLPDANSIASVHFYWPLGFTHQGESWMDTALSRFQYLPFPTRRDAPEVAALAATLNAEDLAVLDEEFLSEWTSASIEADFIAAANWSRRNGVPVILGEFGALADAADTRSRANWIRATRKAAETHGMGWLYWDLDDGFGFLDDRASPAGLNRDLVDALLA